MKSCAGLILPFLLVLMARAQTAPASARPFCEMVAGDGISLTQIAGLEPLRHDLILQALRLCPAEFISIASSFPEPDKVLNDLSGLEGSDTLTGTIAKDAARNVKSTSSLVASAFVRRLLDTLAKPVGGVAAPVTLLRADRRDSRILAELAGEQKTRTGDKQEILLSGTFIMWIANRGELNSAFQRNPASLAWLRPYPPGYGLVGPGAESTEFDNVAAAIVNRASQGTGPIDQWFRGFRVEH
jgi:hypothetical protein